MNIIEAERKLAAQKKEVDKALAEQEDRMVRILQDTLATHAVKVRDQFVVLADRVSKAQAPDREALKEIVLEEIDALFPEETQAKADWKDEALEAFKEKGELQTKLEAWMTDVGRVNRRADHLQAVVDQKVSARWRGTAWTIGLIAAAQAGLIVYNLLFM